MRTSHAVMGGAILAMALLGGGASLRAGESEEGLYLRFDTGRSFVRIAEKDPGGLDRGGEATLVDGGIGYRVNRYLRGDVTAGYLFGCSVRMNGAAGGESISFGGNALVGMVNVYADVARFGRVTSYVGGGVGLARNTANDTLISLPGATGRLEGDSRTSLAWQLMVGLDISIAPNWTIDGGYRYLNLGEARTGDTLIVNGIGIVFPSGATSLDVRAHEARVGIRYQF